jgi:hypothetical protein
MTSSLPSLPERVTFETAAAHACTQVPMATPTSRADDIRQALVGQRTVGHRDPGLAVDRDLLCHCHRDCAMSACPLAIADWACVALSS